MDHSRLKGSTVPPRELQHEASSKLERLDSCVRGPMTWHTEVKKKKLFFFSLTTLHMESYVAHSMLHVESFFFF